MVGALSRRRCCLCVFLRDYDQPVRGQVAHLDRDRSNNDFDNLIWLCLDHHDEYDSRTSQSKGLTEGELRIWRDRLVQKYDGQDALWSADRKLQDSVPEEQSAPSQPHEVNGRVWKFPLWQVEDQLDLFAYTAKHSDGVCLIERIDLPDGRIVVACLQALGNPGTSITNGVEQIAVQVCERFEIPPAQLVWLEHYPFVEPQEWNQVEFGRRPPEGDFADPTWTVMRSGDWRSLRLRPLVRLRNDGFSFYSKLEKRFSRP